MFYSIQLEGHRRVQLFSDVETYIRGIYPHVCLISDIDAK